MSDWCSDVYEVYVKGKGATSKGSAPYGERCRKVLLRFCFSCGFIIPIFVMYSIVAAVSCVPF